ncbi:hypothetical protein ID866_6411 [Astraeus odoratus]|nr:hypothetical protein ID866_6411 [Astraeus odoratus]
MIVARYAGANALELIYGRTVEGKDDPVLSLANEVAQAIKRLPPGTVGLLISFPMLRYLPSWFPGASFKKDGQRCKVLVDSMADIPFTMAKKEMQRGLLPPCLASDVLKNEAVPGPAEKDALTGVFVGGSETTATALKILALVMVLNQDIQDRVHAELDAVVGKGMIPTFEDRERLPYLQAVLYEVMRWHPVVPIDTPGLAHFTTTSDVYEGYYIPKGSVVIFNVWSMKDHEYIDPERFDPTRHLAPDGQLKPESKQRNSIYFGFGRRVCPGRYFAENALWAAAAVMLSALRFEKAKDSSGDDIYPDPIFPPGAISCPVPFKCSIINRFG